MAASGTNRWAEPCRSRRRRSAGGGSRAATRNSSPRPNGSAAAGDRGHDAAGADLGAVDVVVVAAVGEERARFAAGPTGPAADRRDRIEQGKQRGDVVAVATCQQDRERGAVAVDDQTSGELDVLVQHVDPATQSHLGAALAEAVQSRPAAVAQVVDGSLVGALPMALLFFAGSHVAPQLITRFGLAALSAGAVVQLAGLASLVTVVVGRWPHVSLWAMALPLALVGAGQSMLFAGLFRSVLATVPTHLAGIGSGVLITLQQSGLALGVATLGTLYLALAPDNIAHAFAGVEYVQMGIVALLAVGAAALPRLTKATSAATPIIDA